MKTWKKISWLAVIAGIAVLTITPSAGALEAASAQPAVATAPTATAVPAATAPADVAAPAAGCGAAADVSLRNLLDADAAPQTSVVPANDPTADAQPAMGPPFPHYCKCSCGAPCETDADCGGAVGSCRTFITCC